METERSVDWGHWGLTLVAHGPGGRNRFYNVPFPVGAQGPIDGTLGSPARAHWQAVCKAWTEHGVLPSGATRVEQGHSRWTSTHWTPCPCGAEFVQDCKAIALGFGADPGA